MYRFTPIGHIRSCFRQKFGIPRQPALVPAARALLELLPPYAAPEAVRGLEGFSHIWVVFVFHGVRAGLWHPTVRPPRLGGRQRLGVYATRSTFRPNPIGLSAVELEGIEIDRGRARLRLKGVDLLDGTPVLDIKPYLPYADCIPEARGGFAPEPPTAALNVEFSPQAEAACAAHPGEDLRELIVQLLRHDPRPAYLGENAPSRRHGMRLYDWDVQWEMREGAVLITQIVPVVQVCLSPPSSSAISR